MPKYKRHKTKYPGVFFIDGKTIDGNRTERIYYINFRRGGVRYEEKAGRQYRDNMTAAKAALIRSRKITGELLPNAERRRRERAERWTINDIWNEFRVNKAHLKSLDSLIYKYGKHLRDPFGDRTPESLKAIEIDRFRAALIKTRSPRTTESVLQLLRRLLNYGAEHDLCPLPTFKIRMPKFDGTKTEDLTGEQFDRLIIACDADMCQDAADIMRLAMYTGMRKGEMLKLQWRDVDFDRGFLHLRDPKGVQSEKIPMNEPARDVLQGRRALKRGSWVFSNADGKQRHRGAFARQLRRIRETAGLPSDFRPLHGLRHFYASTLASSGKVDMYTLQRLLGHKSARMTQRYAHLRDETLKKAADVAGELLKR